MSRIFFKHIFYWFFLSFSICVRADDILMKNGDRITGTLINVLGGEMLFETDYAGRVSILVNKITAVNTEDDYEILFKGEKVDGRLVFDSDTQYVLDQDRRLPILFEDIGQISKKRNSFAPMLKSWRSRADLSLILSEGNSETSNYNVFVESILKRSKSEHAVALLINNEKAETVLTRKQFDLDYGYKRFISDKWFASGTAEYFEDELKDIEGRITMSGGAGYQFWDNSIGEFSIDLSMSAVQEKIGEDDEINPAIRFGLDYRRLFLRNKMELFHRQTVLSIPDSERGQVINASTGIRYELSTFIDTAFRIDTNYETKPAPGREKTDLTFTVGMGLKF